MKRRRSTLLRCVGFLGPGAYTRKKGDDGGLSNRPDLVLEALPTSHFYFAFSWMIFMGEKLVDV